MTTNYTREQCERHYEILIETIQFLLNNRTITEDWIEYHKKIILKYDEAFPCGFNYINGEITNSRFRNLAKKAHILLGKLITDIRLQKIFNKNDYKEFCIIIRDMVMIVSNEDDDFINSFSSMKL